MSFPVDDEIIERTLELAATIQQIPAPTFAEFERAEFIRSRFEAEGLCDIEVDVLGNVYGRTPGKEHRRPVVVSAHTDTVFPAETHLHIERQTDQIHGPGIGDNSLGVAGLFGLLWALKRRPAGLSQLGDLWLVANVGEEGLGDLRGMRAVVDRFLETPRAYLVLEGLALGQIYHRGLPVLRYRIKVQTGGGHSWVDFGRPSAIHEAARLINRITELPIPDRPRTTLNVGLISGGTSVNALASAAEFELDLRSENVQVLQSLAAQVEILIHAACQPDVLVTGEKIGNRPAGRIPGHHPLVQLARRCLQEQGIQPYLGIGSTDANIPLSRGYPAICIGLSTGGRAHTLEEYIETAPLIKGLGQLTALVEGAFREL